MPTHKFPQERHEAILEHLYRHGRVSVKVLREELQVTEATIRQDLQKLEEQGYLYRTYGGALPLKRVPDQQELAFDKRMSQNKDEKAAIGKYAAALVEDGFGIALDCSTSACSIVQYLSQRIGLTVVTNNLMVSQLMLALPKIEVLLPRGRLRRDSNSIVGEPESLPNLNLNIGFFSAWGLSLEEGLTEIDAAEMQMKQYMASHCASIVIVIDSSKWGKVAPYTFEKPQNVSRIITDSGAPRKMIEQFQEAGITVDIVPVSK
jgi:DeoR/GlpR family transcriptional regulator of sugar metabolism